MAKKIVFYTKDEIAELKQLIRANTPVNEQSLGEFCKKNNRTYGSASVKYYSLKKQMGETRSKGARKAGRTRKKNNKLLKNDTVFVPRKNTPFKGNKGEFRVPINSWSISQEPDSLYFVVKF